MHWLKEWRENYVWPNGRKGISRKEFASMVRVPGTERNPEKEIGCSVALIFYLEEFPPDKGGVTQPAIADRIAEVTGATPQQRDMLVHEMHRGTWKPKAQTTGSRKPNKDNSPPNKREVVKLNRSGQVMKRLESLHDAARDARCTFGAIYNRCSRILNPGTDEFAFFDCTWRYADEWDSMDQTAKTNDLRAAGMKGTKEEANAKA